MSKKDPILDSLGLVGELPTLPTVALEVTRLLDDPASTPKQITEVMKADQAITSKVLRLVNSPYYGIRGGVSTVERAISYLGYNTIFQLLIGVSVLEFSRIGGESGIDVLEFWKHSLGVAVAAETIGRKTGFGDPSELFAAGLLHDLGKLALAKIARNKFSNAITLAKKDGIPLRNAEREVGLPTHDRVGGILAQNWRIPPILRAAISMHHQEYELRSQTVSRDLQPMVDAVVLADALCKRFEIGDGGDNVVPDMDKKLLKRLGLDISDVEQIKGEMTRLVEQTKSFLELLERDL